MHETIKHTRGCSQRHPSLHLYNNNNNNNNNDDNNSNNNDNAVYKWKIIAIILLIDLNMIRDFFERLLIGGGTNSHFPNFYNFHSTSKNCHSAIQTGRENRTQERGWRRYYIVAVVVVVVVVVVVIIFVCIQSTAKKLII